MAEVLLLLGGDRGELEDTFAQAAARITARIGPVLAQSRDHWTEPWGFADDHLFLNRALLIASGTDPRAIMPELLRIEAELGRVRDSTVRYAPRTIDIDLLLVGEEVIDAPGLTVPHPRMHQRAFALAPAADVVPGWVHPLLRRTVLDLLNDVLRTG